MKLLSSLTHVSQTTGHHPARLIIYVSLAVALVLAVATGYATYLGLFMMARILGALTGGAVGAVILAALWPARWFWRLAERVLPAPEEGRRRGNDVVIYLLIGLCVALLLYSLPG